MKKRLFSLMVSLVVLGVTIFGGAPLFADPPEDQLANLSFSVLDGSNGKGFQGVAFTLKDSKGDTRNAISDENGDVNFSGVATGAATLSATTPRGYIGLDSLQITLTPNDNNLRNNQKYWSFVKAQYSIGYNWGGGTQVSGNPTSYAISDHAIAIANPTREGYTFLGWTVGHGGEQRDVGPSYSIPAGTTGDIELLARWELLKIETYNIVYKEADEATNDNPISYEKSDVPIAIANPTREGYTFLGWTVGHGGEQSDVGPSYSIPAGTTGDIELLARWELSKIETYNIVYKEVDDATNDNPTSYERSDVPIAIGNPTRDGYTFVGWTVGHGGEQSDVGPSYSIPAGTTGDIELLARWELSKIETYEIKYNLDDGTNDPGNPNVYKTDKLPIDIAAPTRTGYSFTGWLVSYADEDWTDITTPTQSYSIPEGTTGNITLTAVWSEATTPTTSLTFKKLDASNRNAPLKDVGFTLTYEDGKAYTARSDHKGTVTFTNVPTGTAVLEEKTPMGYVGIEPIRLTLEEKATNKLPDSYKGNTLYNYAATGDLSFIKVDASNHNAPLKGVAFTLTDRYGKTHKAVSDAKGFIRFKDIPVGRAQLTEKALRGYMDVKPIQVTLREGKNTLPRFDYPGNVLPNHLISASLTFKIIDASKGNRSMAGVTFAITDRYGTIHIATSNHKGIVCFDNIPVGQVFLEGYAPVGYIPYAGMKFKLTEGSNYLPVRDFPHNIYVSRMERTTIVPKVPMSGF